MGRGRDAGLEAVRRMVRDAYLDTSTGWARDPEVYDQHPTELQFASYLDRLLSSEEEATFESHVALCSRCAEELVLSSRVATSQHRKEVSSYWKMAAGFVLALGALVGAVVAGRSAGGYIEDGLLAGLEAGLGGKASAEAVSVSLLGGPRVDLDGLQVDDPSGDDPLVVAPHASFEVDLAALRDGTFSGVLELDRPVINVVKNASGAVNIDSLLPSSERLSSLFAAAAGGSVRSVKIKDGTIRILDEAAAGPREVRMADVDAELTGLSGRLPASLRARAGIESASQNLALVGTLGPWGGGAPPRYDFTEVDLDAIPLGALAWAREAVRGGLSYDGTLRATGEGWNEVSSNLSGAGRMQVVSGAIVGRNLVAETIRPWLGSEAPAGLAVVLASRDTPFEDIQSAVSIRRSGLVARDLRVHGQNFDVVGKGSLESSGEVDFTGTLLVSNEVSAQLVAMVPFAGRLLDEKGQLAVPFEVDGTWPDVRPRVDLELVASRTIPLPRLAVLWLAPAFARAG